MDRTRAGADKKRLQVNSAALVDLKAALFRKQQEYKKEKSTSLGVVQSSSSSSAVAAPAHDATESAGRKVSDKTASVWLSASKKAKKKDGGQGSNGRNSWGEQRNARDSSHQLSQYEEEQLAKSRRALEAKAALYERLSRGDGLREAEEEDGGEEEGEGGDSRYMVDFTRKVWEDHMNNQSPPRSPTSSREKESSRETKQLESVSGIASSDQSEEREPTPPPRSTDEEWVEYVDSFGRTRSCLRKDLPEFMKLDQQLETKTRERRETNRSPTPELLSEDMRRERERKQWEQDAEEELDQDKPIGPVHYQELRGGEIRTHGAGYYAFSVEEEQRREQIGLLNKLREQTTSQREKREKLQEKRKALLEARLAKVRQRKLKQNPEEANQVSSTTVTQNIADFDFDKGQSSSSAEEHKPEKNEELSMLLARAKEQAELEQERQEEEKRRAHVRPWDRGKVVDPIKKRKQELRDERQSEFAPPSIYSSSSSSSSKSSSYEQPSSSKQPKTDDSADDHMTTSTSAASQATHLTNTVAGGVTAPPFNPAAAGGYFYPPAGVYPPPPPLAPPFGVPPPHCPPAMMFAPPPTGFGPYFAPPHPPPPPMSVGVAIHYQAPQPGAQSQSPMRPPPPPPGLPPDSSD